MIRIRKEASAQRVSHRDREMPGLSLVDGESTFCATPSGVLPGTTQQAPYWYTPAGAAARGGAMLGMAGEITPTPRTAAGG